MTAVAVKVFDIDWTLKIVSTVTGVAPRRRWRRTPLPQHPVAVDDGDGQAGDLLAAMSSGILAR